MGGKGKKKPAVVHRRTRAPADIAARLASGNSLSSIAADLNCDREQVAKWNADPKIQAEIARIEAMASEDAIRMLKGAKGSAVSRLVAVLDGKKCEACGRSPATDRDAIRASEAILGRTGLPVSNRTEVSGSVKVDLDATLSEPQMEAEILEEAALIAEEAGDLELSRAIRAFIAKQGGRP